MGPKARSRASTASYRTRLNWNGRAIAFQTVEGRNQSPQMAAYLQEQFRAGGLAELIQSIIAETQAEAP